MSAPIKSYKKGGIQLNVWQGSFEGKTTYTYSIVKNYLDKKDNQWKESKYYNETDLMNICFLIQTFFVNKITKGSEKPPVVEQPVIDPFSDVPF